MSEVGSAYVSLLPSARGFGAAASREIDPQLAVAGDSGGKKFGGGMLAAATKFVGPLAAAFAAVKVVDFLGDSIDEAREAEKVGKLTSQVIKSTGGVANISAKQVGNLAGALSNKTGIDDEVIQSGSNLLLTFKNVRNEVGKGNNVFDKATAAAVDLSAAGFGSVETTSKQLGKALNDPIAGITALGRAGVTFTDEQKAMIEGMVQSGDLLGAQKIILGEVESQVGGAAEASATAGEKLAVAWGNFKENIGTALLPLIDKGMSFLTDTVIPALTDLGPKLSAGADIVRDFFGRFTTGGGEAQTKLQQFRTFLTSTWESVKSIFTSGVTIVQNLWRLFGDNIVSYAKSAFDNIMQVLGGAFTFIQGIFNVFAGLLSGDWGQFWEGIKQVVSGAWDVIKGLIDAAWNAIKFAFSNAGVVLGKVFQGIWDGLKAGASAGIAGIISIVIGLPGAIVGALGNLGKLLVQAGKDLIQGLIDGITSMVGKLGDKLGDIAGGAVSTVKGVLGINSPSRVFREIGVDTVDGMLLGLESGRSSVQSAFAGLADPQQETRRVAQSVRASLVGSEATSPMSARPIEVNVHPSMQLNEEQLAEYTIRRMQFAMAGAGGVG